MSSYSCFCIIRSNQPLEKNNNLNEDEICLMSRYHLPIIWLALFDNSSLKTITHDDDIYFYLISEKEKSLKLLKSRMNFILNKFPHLDILLLDEFLKNINIPNLNYFHLDVSEIGGMISNPHLWNLHFSEMLNSFSVPIHLENHGWNLYSNYFGAGKNKENHFQFYYFGDFNNLN